MSVKVLYEEFIRGGRDEESQHPNGVWVRLTHWVADNNHYVSLRDHYMIESSVMVNREIVEEKISTYPERWNKDSEYIRQAIGIADELKESIEGD